MPARHVVVDGSNIATEGNSLPSLKQLDEAVREYLRENPDDTLTVVVDATFGHRIPPEERELFEQAERDGDIVSPPAGAIGRGDAFLLRIADKVGAVVLSNDSFQEFHGEHEWLFDEGRLIGGKPVPGVGWIFTPRIPVRGPKSRESLKEAKRKRQGEEAPQSSPSGLELAAGRAQGRSGTRKLQRAIEVATEEAVLPDNAARKRRRRRKEADVPSEPVNEPLAFINFIASYRPGDELEGSVEEFSSHGAYVKAGGARCYLPLSAMGDPPPRSAREVLSKGEARRFVVQAFDPMRRGIELALPGFAHPAGAPTPETVEAEIHHVEELASAELAVLDGAAPTKPTSAAKTRARRATKAVAADIEGAGTAQAEGAGIAQAGPSGEPAAQGERVRKPSRRSTSPGQPGEGPLAPLPEAEGPQQADKPARKRPKTLGGANDGAGDDGALGPLTPEPLSPGPTRTVAGKGHTPRATKAKAAKPKLTVLPGALVEAGGATASRRPRTKRVAGAGTESLTESLTEGQLDR